MLIKLGTSVLIILIEIRFKKNYWVYVKILTFKTRIFSCIVFLLHTNYLDSFQGNSWGQPCTLGDPSFLLLSEYMAAATAASTIITLSEHFIAIYCL